MPLLDKIIMSDIKQKDDGHKKLAQSIILCPTRELAIQSANAIGSYAANAHMHTFDIVAIYGGAPFLPQKRAIEKGVDTIVATPGRLIDMLSRKIIDLSSVKMAVLDEADEMLKMGFTEDVDTILGEVSKNNAQICMFSATMPSAVEKISLKYQKNPVTVKAQKVSSTSENIEQNYAVVSFKNKTEATRRIILNSHAKATIIFVKTRATATSLSEDLTTIGIPSVTISGDVPQNERERIVEGMRKGKIKVLVATDVAARGLDIEAIELVINFDLPMEDEAYVHRIGRTGRAGRQGRAISLVNPREQSKLQSIEKTIGMQITEVEIPSLDQIAQKQAKVFIKRIKERVEKGRLDKYYSPVAKLIADASNEKDIVKSLSAVIALAVHDYGEEETSTYDFTEKFSSRKNDRSSNKNSSRKPRSRSKQNNTRNSHRRDGEKSSHNPKQKSFSRNGSKGSRNKSPNHKNTSGAKRHKKS